MDIAMAMAMVMARTEGIPPRPISERAQMEATAWRGVLGSNMGINHIDIAKHCQDVKIYGY